MDIETLDKANILKRIIENSEIKLNKLEEMKANDEIIIIVSNSEVKKALEVIAYRKNYEKPSYYKSKLKEKVMDALIKDESEIIDGCLKEFENL